MGLWIEIWTPKEGAKEAMSASAMGLWIEIKYYTIRD